MSSGGTSFHLLLHTQLRTEVGPMELAHQLTFSLGRLGGHPPTQGQPAEPAWGLRPYKSEAGDADESKVCAPVDAIFSETRNLVVTVMLMLGMILRCQCRASSQTRLEILSVWDLVRPFRRLWVRMPRHLKSQELQFEVPENRQCGIRIVLFSERLRQTNR